MFHRAAKAYNWFYNKTMVNLTGHQVQNDQTQARAHTSCKFDKTNVKYMSPSLIHYMSCDDDRSLWTQFDVPALSERILADGVHPKVQAVYIDGHWFTLNNLQLEVCRKLESDGRCSTVQVNIVMLKDVPAQMKKLMVVPQHHDTSRATSPGYQKVGKSTIVRQEECTSDEDDDDDDDDDDSSDDDDDDCSDIDSDEGTSVAEDWTDDDDFTDDDHTGSETSDEDEEDSLL